MMKYDKLFALLEANGYNSTDQRNRSVGARDFHTLKESEGGLDNRSIDRICRVFGVKPGDIMEYVADTDKLP